MTTIFSNSMLEAIIEERQQKKPSKFLELINSSLRQAARNESAKVFEARLQRRLRRVKAFRKTTRVIRKRRSKR